MMDMRGNEKKWEKNFIDFSGWNTPQQRRTQEQEAQHVLAWILEKQLPAYRILELGCGNGHVGKIISEGLAARAIPFTYHFTDMLPVCVDSARAEMRDAVVSPACLSFSTLDVYEAPKYIQPGTYNIIISTGFISAATYKDAVPGVAKLLSEGGLLIADFINHFSLSVFLPHPVRECKRAILFFLGRGKSYHFGRVGIRSFFERHGLSLMRYKTIRLRRNPLLCMFKKQSK